jgi:glycosyltransferase involved in cell wall biosynthesis
LKDQVVHDYRLPASHVSVVLNGVDLALFSRPVDSEAVRRRYALGTDPLVVFVGTFQPWHGVEFLVSGFRTVIERFPTAKLLLAGDGPGRDAIATLIGGSGLSPHTTLTGRLTQPEVAEVVGAADVVVAPYGLRHTDVVGTPLKVVEYMAAGKAIVVSTAPIHELITDGVTGLRVAPAASEPLAEGITRLLGDSALRTRLGDAAQLEARRYSWDAVVSTLERLFEAQIAARQRVRPAAGRQS